MNFWTQVAKFLLSAFWTAMFVGPVYVFCARHVPLSWIWGFLVVGVVFLFLPKAALRRMALSGDERAYRRLGVPLVIRMTQDAGWLRRLGGGPVRARRSRRALAQMERDTWMRERFHLGLFCFYLLCSLAALIQGMGWWCLFLVVANVFYNLYPVWLQQYLRLRVVRCLGRAG